MSTVRRFASFDELKAAERITLPEPPATVLKRHRAFERLMAAIREHIVRSSARTRRSNGG